jgi:exosome complex RNA-binding protein Csl4
MVTDGSNAKGPKSIQLGRTRRKGSQVGGRVQRVDLQSVLEVRAQGVEELGHQIQTPQRNLDGEEWSQVVVGSEEFVRGQIDPMTGDFAV